MRRLERTKTTAHPDGDGPGRKAWPPVSVVILSYNRAGALAVTLEKVLYELDYPADRLECIVVDNASEDDTAEMVARHAGRVTLLVNGENIGVAGWNRGLHLGRGDYFLILDDDCYITGDVLKRAVEAAEAYRADLVSFTVLTSYAEHVAFNDLYETGLLSFWGCSALFSKRAVDRLGGYDGHIFLWANELEFTMRALAQGLRHLFLKEATSVHMKRPKDPGVYSYRAHRLNTRNFAFIAAKLFRPAHAATALLNLAVGLALMALKRPAAWRIFPALWEGWRTGLKHRDPVRPEISSLYRYHFPAFLNPVPFMLRLRRWPAFYRRRRRLYPEGTALLDGAAIPPSYA